MRRSKDMLAMLFGICQRDGVIFRSVSQTLTAGNLIERARLLADQLPDSRQRILIPSDNAVAVLAGIAGCWLSDNTAVVWRKSAMDLGTLSDLTAATAVANWNQEAGNWHIERLRTDCSAQPGDLVVMTSGSTGKPKGVALDLQRVVTNAALAGSKVDVTSASIWTVDADMSLMSPLGHTFMAWANQVPVVHLGGMDWASRRELFAENVSGFGGAPLQIREMVQRLNGAGPRIMVSSGDFLPSALGRAVEARFPDTRLHKIYGLTEVSGRLCVLPHPERQQHPDAAGFPLPGFEVFVDKSSSEEGDEDGVGELCVSGPTLMHGYWRSDVGFTPIESTYFRTGDLGSVQSNGLVTINGRRDDVFKVGAEKVDRLSIEQALQDVLAGHDFCVLPVVHNVLGQTPILFIATKNGKGLPSRNTIIRVVRSKLPSRFAPSLMLSIGEALPKLPNGKLDKQFLINNFSNFPDVYAR